MRSLGLEEAATSSDEGPIEGCPGDADYAVGDSSDSDAEPAAPVAADVRGGAPGGLEPGASDVKDTLNAVDTEAESDTVAADARRRSARSVAPRPGAYMDRGAVAAHSRARKPPALKPTTRPSTQRRVLPTTHS